MVLYLHNAFLTELYCWNDTSTHSFTQTHTHSHVCFGLTILYLAQGHFRRVYKGFGLLGSALPTPAKFSGMPSPGQTGSCTYARWFSFPFLEGRRELVRSWHDGAAHLKTQEDSIDPRFQLLPVTTWTPDLEPRFQSRFKVLELFVIWLLGCILYKNSYNFSFVSVRLMYF